MKKSTTYLVLAVFWIILGLVWFFGSDNTFLGIVWLCAGVAEAAIAFISYSKEKKQ